MANQAEPPVCPRCVELERRVAALEAQLAAALDKLATALDQLAETQRQLAETQRQLAAARKTSANSSKPPSSDLVKPPPPGGKPGAKRHRGAQPGHPRHERAAFTPAEIDRIEEHRPDACPDCGGDLEALDEPARVVQQVELLPRPVVVTEHRGRACRCRKCRREFPATLPKQVRQAGLLGSRLTALVAYLKGRGHCSFTTIQHYLREICGVRVSRGQLRKVCGKVATSLDPAYSELLNQLPAQNSLNVDETGHKENGKGHWTWCFRAALFTLFKIDPSRGSEVLVETLGLEFDGVLGCDYYSAYHKYMRLNENVLVQFCLAHLIRDVKFLVEHPHSRNRAYGRRVLTALRELFAILHRRAEFKTKAAFRQAMEAQGWEVWRQATYRVPATNEAQNLAQRFDDHGAEYLRFVTTPGVEPTNNLAEQAIRFVVLDRRVTQGTRSPAGRSWCERIWTTIATCTQQGRGVFDFLLHTVQAYFGDSSPPSLLSPAN